MKKIAGLLFFAALALLPKNAAAQQKAMWKEMYDFHEVMSTTFHPSEEGNFAPLKEKSGMLVEKAVAWQKSAVPAGYDAKLTKSTLKRLVKQCKVINKSVKAGASDKDLATQIVTAHDIFHEIMEKCKAPAKTTE